MVGIAANGSALVESYVSKPSAPSSWPATPEPASSATTECWPICT